MQLHIHMYKANLAHVPIHKYNTVMDIMFCEELYRTDENSHIYIDM